MRAFSLLASALLMLSACGEAKRPAEGSERGACYGNNTCNEGLSCYSELCVQAPDTSAMDGQQREIQSLREKLKVAEMTISRLKSLREAEERSQPLREQPTTKLPSARREKRKSDDANAAPDWGTLSNPFEDSGNTKKRLDDPCEDNPNLPECMLD